MIVGTFIIIRSRRGELEVQLRNRLDQPSPAGPAGESQAVSVVRDQPLPFRSPILVRSVIGLYPGRISPRARCVLHRHPSSHRFLRRVDSQYTSVRECTLRPSLHGLDLKRRPRELRSLCLHGRRDSQIGQSSSDHTTGKPQVLWTRDRLAFPNYTCWYGPHGRLCPRKKHGCLEGLTACAIFTASDLAAILIRAKGLNALSVKT